MADTTAVGSAEGREDAAELVRMAYATALKTIQDHQDWLMKKAEKLVDVGTLSGEDLFEGLGELRGGTMTEGQLWAKRLSWKLAQGSSNDENPPPGTRYFPGRPRACIPE